MTTYDTNGLTPFVAEVAQQVAEHFKLSTIYGWRATATDMTGHPAGLAVDFYVGTDTAKGNQVAAYFLASYKSLRVKYVLWQQQSWYPDGKGWQPMASRTSAPGEDANHLRHVHVSFTAAAGDGSGAGVLPGFGKSTLEQATEDADKTAAEAAGNSWVRTAGDAVDSAVDAVTDPLGVLTSGATWKRVAYVIGGAGLMAGGFAFLIATSKEGSAALAAIPQTRAVGMAAQAIN